MVGRAGSEEKEAYDSLFIGIAAFLDHDVYDRNEE